MADASADGFMSPPDMDLLAKFEAGESLTAHFRPLNRRFFRPSVVVL
jgi:hypothetical protein